MIEQLTYLIFLRSRDEKERDAQRDETLGFGDPNRAPIFPQTPQGQELRWNVFKTRAPREMFEIVGQKAFPFMKTLHRENGETAFSRYVEDAAFLIPTPQVLDKIVKGLDALYNDVEVAKNLDLQGDLYEYMLGKLSTAGQNGQFRTPKHIRETMTRLVAPRPTDFVCDPACGTAGFLVSTAEYVREKYGKTMKASEWAHFTGPMFTGFDTDRTMLRLSAMNLALHSITTPEARYLDSVSKDDDVSSRFDVVLANPPFTGTVDAERIAADVKAVCNTKKTELLFIALFLRLLKKGGRCACVVPDGVLFGSSKAHKALRRELVENHQLRAVISLPSGVFKPYAGVSTAILVFTKTGAGGTENVWFYDVKADGYTLDDKRSETDANDLPDLLKRFEAWNADPTEERARKRSDASFFVPKSKIAANDYDLSMNRYKEVVYEQVEYEAPATILGRLEKIDEEIAERMCELKAALKE